MAMSPSTLNKLIKEELSNMAFEYQHKFDSLMSNINRELTALMDRFKKIESQLLVTRRVNNNLLKKKHILERKLKTCCK